MPPLKPDLIKDGGINPANRYFKAYDHLDEEQLLEFERIREDFSKRGYPLSAYEVEYISRILYEEMYNYKFTDAQRAQYHGMTLTEYLDIVYGTPDPEPDIYTEVPISTKPYGPINPPVLPVLPVLPVNPSNTDVPIYTSVAKKNTSHMMPIIIAALLIILFLIFSNM
jgi:hypothetical protein